MKRILAFGDSNTWGYDPATRERYDKDIRWTGLLQNALGDDALILEEGLCGRTTVFDDANRAGRNGFAALPSILKAVEPIDTAIIMLGTNDCKSVFGASAEVIAAGMEKCIAKLTEYVKPDNILLISPIFLENAALNSSYDRHSLRASRELKPAYQKIAESYGTAFLAASDIAKASEIDGEHLTEDGHRTLADVVSCMMPTFKNNKTGESKMNINETKIAEIVDVLMDDYNKDRTIDEIKMFDSPEENVIIDILEKLKTVIFPGYYRNTNYRTYTVRNHISILLEDIIYNLSKQIAVVLKYAPQYENESLELRNQISQRTTFAFLEKIPKIREYIETDVQAFYDGDPAAYNRDEIIFTYPGLYAIFTSRIAHELYLLNVPLIPRIMTEHAHSLTGIDIHPGTSIGKYFFIDHGTGIVIGETAEIGNNVKIYQGVTIGALSTRGGQNLHGKKRHPTICDNVTIYSGASILGGDTVVGKDVVVGGNAFITKSIPEGAKVSVKSQELMYNYDSGNPVERKEIELDESWFYMI